MTVGKKTAGEMDVKLGKSPIKIDQKNQRYRNKTKIYVFFKLKNQPKRYLILLMGFLGAGGGGGEQRGKSQQ